MHFALENGSDLAKCKQASEDTTPFDWKSAVEHDGGFKCVIVYPACDILAIAMYASTENLADAHVLIVYRLYNKL